MAKPAIQKRFFEILFLVIFDTFLINHNTCMVLINCLYIRPQPIVSENPHSHHALLNLNLGIYLLIQNLQHFFKMFSNYCNILLCLIIKSFETFSKINYKLPIGNFANWELCRFLFLYKSRSAAHEKITLCYFPKGCVDRVPVQSVSRLMGINSLKSHNLTSNSVFISR